MWERVSERVGKEGEGGEDVIFSIFLVVLVELCRKGLLQRRYLGYNVLSVRMLL